MRIRNILQDCHYQSNSHAKEQRETFEWVSALLRSDQIVHQQRNKLQMEQRSCVMRGAGQTVLKENIPLTWLNVIHITACLPHVHVQQAADKITKHPVIRECGVQQPNHRCTAAQAGQVECHLADQLVDTSFHSSSSCQLIAPNCWWSACRQGKEQLLNVANKAALKIIKLHAKHRANCVNKTQLSHTKAIKG